MDGIGGWGLRASVGSARMGWGGGDDRGGDGGRGEDNKTGKGGEVGGGVESAMGKSGRDRVGVCDGDASSAGGLGRREYVRMEVGGGGVVGGDEDWADSGMKEEEGGVAEGM